MVVEKRILYDVKYIPYHYNKNYMVAASDLFVVNFSLYSTAQGCGSTKVSA
jgi:hypothetical protein